MQQLQAEALSESHMQVFGSRLSLLVVRLLVLFRHEQFKKGFLVLLFV